MSASFGALGDLYEDAAEVVRRRGRAYPAAIEPISGRRADDVLILHQRRAQLDDRLRAAGQSHVAAVARRGSALHDGEVLVLERVEEGRAAAAVSSYFSMLASCDSLRAEYLAVDRVRRGLASLPLRELAHRAAGGEPLRNGAGRAAALGISVLVTVAAGDGRGFVVGRRHARLATDPGAWHVAPSGMLERSPAADPVLATAAKELREELGIRLGLGDLGARLLVLGVGYDLLRLKPEICLRLDLQEHELAARRLRLTPAEYSQAQVVPLDAQGFAGFWRERPPGALTPAAVASVALLEASANASSA